MTVYSQPVNQHAGRFAAMLLSAWKLPVLGSNMVGTVKSYNAEKGGLTGREHSA